uniref:Uncharacterized protein n=1 Tax=Anguilla anguilla TaxID=7936 RepID=A0A0E9TJA8_ANGAN
MYTECSRINPRCGAALLHSSRGFNLNLNKKTSSHINGS